MQEIQSACAELARHHDPHVSIHALQIARHDHAREVEHDNAIVERDALLSTTKAELKVVKADNRRLCVQLGKSQDMQFGQSSEQSKRRKKKGNDDDDCPVVGSPDGDPPQHGGAEAKSTEDGKPKPRGKLGRQAVDIPAHLPRDIRVIEPEKGVACNCGCSMHLIGEQTIERLTFKPAEVRVIEER